MVQRKCKEVGRTESSGKKSLCKIPASVRAERYLLTKVHITEIALRGATFSKCILCSTILQLIKIAKKWCFNFLCKIICTPPCSNKGKYGNCRIFPWYHGWFLKGYQLPQGLFVKETKTISSKMTENVVFDFFNIVIFYQFLSFLNLPVW